VSALSQFFAFIGEAQGVIMITEVNVEAADGSVVVVNFPQGARGSSLVDEPPNFAFNKWFLSFDNPVIQCKFEMYRKHSSSLSLMNKAAFAAIFLILVFLSVVFTTDPLHNPSSYPWHMVMVAQFNSTILFCNILVIFVTLFRSYFRTPFYEKWIPLLIEVYVVLGMINSALFMISRCAVGRCPDGSAAMQKSYCNQSWPEMPLDQVSAMYFQQIFFQQYLRGTHVFNNNTL